MQYIIYLLGFAWIAAGATAILYPDDYRAYLNGLLTRLDRIWLAMIPAVLGLLLVIAASSTTHRGFVGIIGALAIAKGVLIYFNPGDIFKTSKDWLDRLSDQGCRLMGIVALVLGTVVISWIR